MDIKKLEQLPIINFLRWIFFLPIAIISSFVISGFLNLVVQYVIGWFTIGSIFSWFGAGLTASAIWILLGIKIVPKKNNVVKWILILPLLLVSILIITLNLILDLNYDFTLFNISVNYKWGYVIFGSGMLLGIFSWHSNFPVIKV